MPKPVRARGQEFKPLGNLSKSRAIMKLIVDQVLDCFFSKKRPIPEPYKDRTAEAPLQHYGALEDVGFADLQLAVREVELRALLSPEEDRVFDLALGKPKIQERLSQAAAGKGVRDLHGSTGSHLVEVCQLEKTLLLGREGNNHGVRRCSCLKTENAPGEYARGRTAAFFT